MQRKTTLHVWLGLFCFVSGVIHGVFSFLTQPVHCSNNSSLLAMFSGYRMFSSCQVVTVLKGGQLLKKKSVGAE